MEAPIKRKIVASDTSKYLRSATNTPSTTVTNVIKAKVSTSSVIRTANGRVSPALRSARPASPNKVSPASPMLRSTRSPSPVKSITAKSSQSAPSLAALFDNAGSSNPPSPLAPKAKTSSMALPKRGTAAAATNRVTSPIQTSTLRPSGSMYSLSAPNSAAVSGASSPMLQPRSGPSAFPARGHLRSVSASVSDTSSSIGTQSPSSSSLGLRSDDSTPTIPEAGPSNAGPTWPTGKSPSPPAIRVKSKVSSLVLTSVIPPSPTGSAATNPPSPVVNARKASLTSTLSRSATPRQRSPSISSNVSLSSPPNRPASRPINMHTNHYQPFPIPSLPAPPAPAAIEEMLSHSPPVPFPRSPPLLPKTRPRSGTAMQVVPSQEEEEEQEIDERLRDDDQDERDDDGEQVMDVQSEARTNRKIADLEITNRSLMAINTMLEATKARQAKEIRDLRRKLRETRLILPPRAFAAIRTSEAMMASTSSVPDSPDVLPEKEQDDEDDEDLDLDDPERQREAEYQFDRICSMVTAMYDHASDAVRRANEPPEKEESGVKVLSGVDLDGYHGDDNESEAEVEDTLVDTPLPPSRSPSPSRLPRPVSPPKVTVTAGSPVKFTNPSPLRKFF